MSVARLVVAAGVTALVSCSIWAALESPYKNDTAASDGGDSAINVPIDAPVDAQVEAGSDDALVRAVDAGFIPNAIGAYGDTVYAVDNQAQVHVAYDASVRFTNFWSGDAGGVSLIQRNGVAANANGVFWTVSTGLHYCGIDAGGCGFLPSANARSIAASDSVVAWIDDTGVRTCAMPLDACSPVTLGASRSAVRLAAGPNGVVAWTDGGTIIHFANGTSNLPRDLAPYEVDLLATDATSGDLYWEGPTGVGFLQFDGGPDTVSMLYSNTKPTAIFVRRGVVFWSLAASNATQHCRLDSAASCSPRDLGPTGLRGPQTTHGIIATSRKVLAVVSSGMSFYQPALVQWPLPP